MPLIWERSGEPYPRWRIDVHWQSLTMLRTKLALSFELIPRACSFATYSTAFPPLKYGTTSAGSGPKRGCDIKPAKGAILGWQFDA